MPVFCMPDAISVLSHTCQNTENTVTSASLWCCCWLLRFWLSSLNCHYCSWSPKLNQPQYLSDALHSYQSTRLLRSSTQDLLTVPRHKTVFGGRLSSFAAPRVWNSLPQELGNCETLGTFEKHLKTHLFRQDIILPDTDATQITVFINWILVLYKFFTLLSY